MATLDAPAPPLTPLTPTNPTNGVLPHPDGQSAPPPAAAFDPALMQRYLLSLLPPIFGASSEELEAMLFDAEFEDRVTRFASESGGPLYVVKVKDEVEGMLIILSLLEFSTEL